MSRDKSRDGLSNRLVAFALKSFRPVWRFVQSVPLLERLANSLIINNVMGKTARRPHAFSTHADYTSWTSLTDRRYFGRRQPAAAQDDVPELEEVAGLFKAGSKPVLSNKSTMLFPVFAQWFTDGFLLTDPKNRLKTYSNHEIDFAQIYGLKPSETQALRLRDGKRPGRLKSVESEDGEVAPRLYNLDGTFTDPKFKSLREPLGLPDDITPEAKASLFAFGGDRTNTTPFTAAMTTLFLREHNRVADEIAKNEPNWDDERVFETARNTLTALLIKLVMEEYINHITPYHFQLRADPRVSSKARWNKPHWIPVEFNLLYRWHSMVPDYLTIQGDERPSASLLHNNQAMDEQGLAGMLQAATQNTAWKLGLFNTAEFLMDVERVTIAQGRQNRLASYNRYREAMSYPSVFWFDQITGDQQRIDALTAVYGHVENIEFYPGIMAEDVPEGSSLPPLVGRMVAIDAFSHALTNPLLSENVFNETTFSKVGWKVLHETNSLNDILERNVSTPLAEAISMDL